MVCSKCHRQHGRFQNGKMKKTCPAKLKKQRGAQSRGTNVPFDGEGAVNDAVLKGAVKFGKWWFRMMEEKRKRDKR